MAKVRALVAKQSFAIGRRVIRKGTQIRSDDPLVKGREHFFADVHDTLGIEQATANPGERRAAAKPDNVCDTCGFEAKSAAGLGVHERSHED